MLCSRNAQIQARICAFLFVRQTGCGSFPAEKSPKSSFWRFYHEKSHL